MKAHALICLLCMIILMVAPSVRAEENDVRNNGTDWFEFGSGILQSCKIVRFDALDKHGQYKSRRIQASDPSFKSVSTWLTTNFEKRLNSAPNHPNAQAFLYRYVVFLYSDSEDDAHKIMRVPLTMQTLGASSESALAQKVAELKGMFQ